MNLFLRSISSSLFAVVTLAIGALFFKSEEVWIDFNFQNENYPTGVYTNPTINISPTKAADGVCSQGMVQVNKDQQFFVDLPSLSYLQLNIKSTNTSSARNVQVAYKKDGDADFTVLPTAYSISTAAAFMLHTDHPSLVTNSPITVRITPTNGNIQIHDILAKGTAVMSSDATIHAFKFPQQISSSIDHDNGTISVVVPNGVDLSNLIPDLIELESSATITPNVNTALDFNSPVVYSVTASDGSVKSYTIYVQKINSPLNEIVAFQLNNDQVGNAIINEDEGTITVSIPTGISVGSIVPSLFTISPYATITPAVTVAQDFTNPVQYTVSAQDGSTKTWTIQAITISSSNQNKIYEAEYAEFTGKTDAQHTGFSGNGFVDFQANGENSINFTVCQVEAGSYQADFRYALGKNEERKGRLYVNDYYVTTLDFIPGTSFTDWKTESVVLNLNSGINNIAIHWEQTDGPNLDYLLLQGQSCNEYSLQVNQTNGGEVTVSPKRTNNIYFENEVVSLLGVNRPDLTFTAWSGDLTGNTNPATLTMTKNMVVDAAFTAMQTYSLQVNVDGLGAVTLQPAGGVYAEGTIVTLTAAGVLSNQFIGYEGDATGTNASATVTVTKNMQVTAKFTNNLSLNFDQPVGFAGVVTTEYSNFNGPTTGGQGAEDTLWINGPSDFNLLATSLYNRNRAYKNNRVENGMKPAPLVIVFKEGVYPEGTSSSSAWGNHMMTIQEQGDLTLIGQGNVVLKWGINIKRSWNIIIRNLSFQDYYDDGINIGEPETHHIWIDHCTVGHPTTRPTDQEHPDGGIDIKNGASYVTISWTKYQNSWKTGLVGHSDSNGSEDLGKLKVTYFANHFYNSNSRNPRVRFGQVHVLNNLTEQVSLYGIAASNQSQVFAEGNFYKNTRWPMYADRATADFKLVYGNNSDNGFTSKTGNKVATGLKILNNAYDDSGLPVITSQINPDRLNPGGRSVKFDEFNPELVFTPPYAYSAFPASVVETIIPMFAGAGKVDFFGTNEAPEIPETPLPLPPNYNGLIAFPGAEGYGKFATGGRGGKVVAVTNLNDDGPGSFRDALRQFPEDPLTIIFNVGGVIELQSDIKISRSNLTIAGQTAPGEGICLTGASFIINGARSIAQGGNHGNIIIRYLRSRPIANDPNGKYGIGLENVHNVILDHCSFSWANEENAAIYDNKFTTVQWSIISEGLWSAGHSKGNRSYGGVWGGQYASYHHNLLAHNNGRTVRFNGARAHDTIALVDYRNNVIYNWGTEGHATGGEIEINGGVSKINLVNNYYKPGPATPSRRNFIRPNTPSNDKVGLFYLNGNVMDGNASMSSDNSTGVNWNSRFESLANSNISNQPFAVAVQLPEVTALNAYQAVLENAGAILPKRDSVDARIVEDTKNGTASGMGTRNLLGIIDDPTVVGGLPKYVSSVTVIDTDGDGIPDAYETANGLNPNDATDGNQLTPEGYTHLEKYLNSIVAVSDEGENPEQPISTPFSASWPLLADHRATVTGDILAYDQIIGPNLTGIQFASSYSGTANIWQRVGGTDPGLSTYNENNYIDFKVEHKEGDPIIIDTFSVAIVGGGTGNVRVNLLYSIDNGATFLPLASEENKAMYNGSATLAYSEGGVDPGNHVTMINSSGAATAGGNEYLRIGNLNLAVPKNGKIIIRVLGYLRAEGGVRHIGMHSAYIAGKTQGGDAPIIPAVKLIQNLKNFNQVIPNTSGIQQYQIVFNHTTDPVDVSVDAPFEISLNGNQWSQQLSYTPTLNPDTAKISVRLNSNSVGQSNATIQHQFTGFDAISVPVIGNTLQAGSIIPNVVVAADGSGDFASIQAAIDAAPANRTSPWVIYIKNGKYREKVTVPQNKTYIQLIGESVANTILSWDDYSGKKLGDGSTIGTSTSFTLHVRGNNFAAANLTIENTYGDGSQAVAVHVQADQTVFKNCRFLGNQDTLLVNGNGYKQYFVNCYIDGNVDYIFGSAIAVFESCVLYSKTRTANGSSYITAANTPPGQAHGLVFRNTEMPSNRGNTLYVYGRPWQNGSDDASKAHNKTVFLHTKVGTNLITPAGWSVWNNGTDTDLIHYAEYGTTYFDGTPVDISQRVNWSKQLTETEAATYTNDQIFGDWDPCAVIAGVCDAFNAEVAVSNFKVDKINNQSTFTWNISWPLDGVQYELYKSINNGAFEKVQDFNTSVAHQVNYSFQENLPAAGANFKYILKASIAGYGEHITDTITVSSIPTIEAVGSLSAFKQGVGLASASQVFQLKGQNLLDPIQVIVPAPFEMSVNGGQEWKTGTVSIAPENATIDIPVSVRLNSTTAGVFSGVFRLGTTLADSVFVQANGQVQSTPLPVSNVLANYPLLTTIEDDEAVRHAAVVVSSIGFNNMELSNGVADARVPAFNEVWGMSFAPKADGKWGTSDGGPGGNLNKNYYVQYTISANGSNRIRVDSLLLNASYFNTSSNTRFAVQYSLDGFTTDERSITGGIGMGSVLASTANGAFATPIILTNQTDNNNPYYQLALNQADGVWIEEGQTLTIRMYFSCGSTSAGRYAKIKNLSIKGDVESTLVADLLIVESLSSFNQTIGSPSNVQSYVIQGENLSSDVAVSVNAPFEISVDGQQYNTSLFINQSAIEGQANTIYVRLNGSNIGAYQGTLKHSAEGVDTAKIQILGNVIAAPLIPILTVTGQLENYQQTVGTPSSYQSVNIQGEYIVGDINVIIAPGFEVSTDRVNWVNSSNVFVLPTTNGSINTSLYIRMNTIASQTVNGEITFLAQGLTQNIQVIGTSIVPMRMYPNPARDFITVTHPQLYTVATINIYDLNGKKVSTQQTTSHTAQTNVFVGNLKNGLYYIEFIRLNERKISSFIKQ